MPETRNKDSLLKKIGRVGVLMGGPSSEREISLKSGTAVLGALESLNIDVVGIDIDTEDKEKIGDLLKSNRVNTAFVALHGHFGEDGGIQTILNELNIPYTGSGPFASRLAMDKIASKSIFQDSGLLVPLSRFVDKSIYKNLDNVLDGFPLVIKPARQGSSIGLSIIETKDYLKDAIELAFKYDDKILIERYIHGRELTVGILDDRPLPVIEIVTRNRFFDFQAKYQPGFTDYIIPAELKEDIALKAQKDALIAHRSLGCYGFSRVDMILDRDNRIFILEVNAIPGFTQTSLLPKAARAAGIEFPQLSLKLLELAHEKKK